MQLTREDVYGIAATIGVHLLLLLLLLMFFLRVQPPDPPLAEGMEIDFGMSVEGSGTDNKALPTAPNVSTQTQVNETKATPNQAEDIKTADNSDAAVYTKPVTKPVTETKQPQEEPKKPLINQGALFPGKTNTGGQGNSNTAGNQGTLTGNPNGGGQGGQGSNPLGSGPGGTGISIRLDGRTASSLPKPRYTEQEDGTVVVKITVDRNGNVIHATTDGVRGSTTTNKNLHNEAISAARKAKFDLKPDAPPEQIGYITYTFLRN
jgi:TonB family protein